MQCLDHVRVPSLVTRSRASRHHRVYAALQSSGSMRVRTFLLCLIVLIARSQCNWLLLRPACEAFTQPFQSVHKLLGRRSLFSVTGVVLETIVAPAMASAEAPVQNDFAAIREAFGALSIDPAQPGAKAALESAEATFGRAIALRDGALKDSSDERAKVENVQLRMGRAQARITQNDMVGGARPEKAREAVEDYDVVVKIMEAESESVFSEFADALVKRGLAKEELKDWQGALQDYTRAISAWRPSDGRADVPLRGNSKPVVGDGLGVNPLVLNFRGNVLCRLGRYEEAQTDYREAAAIFSNDRELRESSLSRANEALALFGAGDDEAAVKTMQAVIRKDPGVTDAHVALAASYWGSGDISGAESEWTFACEKIETGCRQYKDLEWVSEIRRWPPTLVTMLSNFLKGRVAAV